MAANSQSTDALKQVWHFFASIKLTVVLLLTLAMSSIIGTLIPQNETPAAYVQAFGEVVYRIFYILDIFDMYRSWWFQLLLLMLAANVVVCSLERLSSTWKIVFTKHPTFNPAQVQRLADAVPFVTDIGPDQIEKAFMPFLDKKFRYTRIEPMENGYCIYSEKGRWTRLGVYAVHLSVLILLIGGLVGSIFGFEGYVNIPEGDTVNTIQLRNSNRKKMLDFSIRCDDFDVQFYDTGAPKEFRSRLTIVEKDREVVEKDIIVNDPLTYKGISIYQSSYGALSAKGATLNFKSPETGMVYTVVANMGAPVDVPEAGGKFVITDYRNTYQFRGRNIGEVFIAAITPASGTASEVVMPLRFPDFDRMRKGDWLISATKPAYWYYTGLQVSKDPSVWIVYAGFIIMILGCYFTFFMSHQRNFVEVVRKKNQTSVRVSGTANKNKLGMHRKVSIIAKKLEGLGK